MKLKFTFQVIALALLVLLSGCVVRKPDSSSISSADYNTRRTITNPHYHKKLSGLGISAIVGGTLGGATGGYFTNMVTYQKGESRVSCKPANAAIGAFVGVSIASLINYACGLNKTVACYDNKEWLKKANKKYMYLSSSNTYNSFIAILPSSENNFSVKNIQDARDFASMFPNSIKTDDVMKSGIQNCTRDNMPELISLFPGSIYVVDAKTAYIQRSSTYEELYYAVSKYPEIKINVESKFVGFVKSISHAKDFATRYPNSNYKKEVVINSFITDSQPSYDILKLKELYPDQFELTASDLSNQSSDIKRNYFQSLYKIENPKSIIELESFYSNYSWLGYNNKSDDIVRNYWEIANGTIEDGNFILYLLNDIATNETYIKWGITKYSVDNFIREQLAKEAKNNIAINSKYEMGTTNDEWDKWCNNTKYTAGLVSEKGDIKFVIYGEVQNKSKFDIPILIEAGSDLNRKSTLQGTGFVSNIISAVSNAYGSEATVKKLSSGSNNFYIPSLPAHTTTSYAVLLNFGEGSTRSGVNIADWIKLKNETYLSNVYVKINYYNQLISNSVLKEQETWLYFAQNGIPNTTLTDLWRGGEVKNTEWNQKLRDILEERARIHAQVIAEMNNKKYSLSSSSSNSENNSCTITVKSDGTISQGKPSYIATIKKGNKSKRFGFYYNPVRNWTHNVGYFESCLIEYERSLGETMEEAKDKILEIMCKEFD